LAGVFLRIYFLIPTGHTTPTAQLKLICVLAGD